MVLCITFLEIKRYYNDHKYYKGGTYNDKFHVIV